MKDWDATSLKINFLFFWGPNFHISFFGESKRGNLRHLKSNLTRKISQFQDLELPRFPRFSYFSLKDFEMAYFF